MSADSFWTENTQASQAMASLTKLKNSLEAYQSLTQCCEDAQAILALIDENPQEAEALEAEAQHYIESFQTKVEALEIQALLSDKHDSYNCIFSLNSGAGGTDAQDWAQILLRLYTRWLDKKQFSYEIIDQTMGEEAGIKSVTLMVKGLFAFGLLKNEVGVHRLVRLSPFNANSKRQTSFAAVDVIPEIEQDFSDLDIDPKDLRIDTFRSSGAGGQHVNKTDSAVRITHIPTGTVAQSQHSRSQISNRETALSILKSRLLQRMILEHKDKLTELRGTVADNSWGNQIRSYVFHPYKLVKDLRSEHETSDLQGVLDGDIDTFIYKYMLHKRQMG